jgi:hypothetical protein
MSLTGIRFQRIPIGEFYFVFRAGTRLVKKINNVGDAAEARPGRRWTFLSSHGQVLLCLARDPCQRLRDIASQVGLTERAVQGIIRDLGAEGYLTCSRVGRRNRYEVHAERRMRHPFVAHCEVRALLGLLDPRGVAVV